MSHATATVDALTTANHRHIALPESQMLIRSEPHLARSGVTLLASLILHTALALVIVLVPLLLYDSLPSQDVLKAFFVQPLELAPPPPPPPPPPASAARAVLKPAPPVQPTRSFVAPIEIPNVVTPEESLDLGVEGGVAGGVEGGVPGGVIGGIVGGLPTAVPPPPPQIVRIGGKIAAPRIVHRVEPVYPTLALAARLTAVVVLEAQVDTHGSVQSVKVLNGHPIFDEAALEAVKQWRYQPLLLNGEPTGFILSVVITFSIKAPN
jgi:protein TonB